MDETERAVAFLNDKDAAIWSIPPELLPDYIEGKPEAAKRLVESTQRMAEIAAELRQWDALRQAIKFLMACQQAVLDWWENNVLRRGHQISQDHGRLATPAAEQIIQFSDSTLSRWRTSLGDPERYEEKLRQAAYRKAGLEPEENHRAEGTGENEWYTPAEYIAAAREVMGGIDLDPATHPIAQQTVRATEFYTRQDDGLSLSWHGRVWLNPPYAQPWIARFVDKMVAEFTEGSVEQAVMLTHNYTDTAWFHKAQTEALLCFTRGRVRFVDPDGELCAPTQGQCFFYFGPERGRFREAFRRFGFVR